MDDDDGDDDVDVDDVDDEKEDGVIIILDFQGFFFVLFKVDIHLYIIYAQTSRVVS